MRLQKYSEINKSVEDIMAEYPSGYNANCYYANLCKPYYIPISADVIADLHWYVPLDKKITDFTFYATDCEGNIEEVEADFHVAGQDGDGEHYLVLKNLVALPSFSIFQLWVEVKYIDAKVQSFFTEQYESAYCDTIGMVYACYDVNDGGGYDINGNWIAEAINPYGVDSTGNINVKYYNNYAVRNLRIEYGGTTMTYSAFKNRAVKTEMVKTYNIKMEVLPYWYEEQIASAFAKGYVYINGEYYNVSTYQSTVIGDPCCEQVAMQITATKETTLAMSCSRTDCIFEDILLPDCTLGELSYTQYTVEGDCTLGNLSYTNSQTTLLCTFGSCTITKK